MEESTTRTDPSLDNIIALYNIESGLIQQKATHILAIRSIALTFLMLMAPYLAVVVKSAFLVSIVVLVPGILAFYLLESVYDSYLIANSDREAALRKLISSRLSEKNGCSEVSRLYVLGTDSSERSWGNGLLLRALARPIRMTYYALLFIAYVLVVALLSGVI
jgi:hypothetical protein